MTQALDIRCQNCGSPLQVGDGIRFVTCTYCNTALQIVRDAASVHSEVLEKIDARTAEMSGSLKTIELQNELERLDREWQMWRESNLPRSKSGKIEDPSPVASIIIGIFAAGFVLMWIIGASTIASKVDSGFASAFPLFGFFVLAVLIFGIAKSVGSGSGYKEAREAYEASRAKLLSQIAAGREKAS